MVNGSKMFITNAETATLFNTAVKTDPDADPPYKGISLLIVEKGPGVTVTRKLDKLGYKGIETCEVVFEDCAVPAENLIGGEEGQGFKQVLAGLEVGRVNIAARAVGVSRAALAAAIRYSQQRETFGKPICEHQAIQLKLADMATKVEAAASADLLRGGQEGPRRALRSRGRHGQAVRLGDRARRSALEAMRIFGGYGYISEFPVERYYRDAPLMLIGEGTNEIQRTVIARQLIERNKI